MTDYHENHDLQNHYDCNDYHNHYDYDYHGDQDGPISRPSTVLYNCLFSYAVTRLADPDPVASPIRKFN